MSRIIICRHGNTFDKGDLVTRVGARTDLPLSSSGVKQAEKLGSFFASGSRDYNFVTAYCSPLKRTRMTAEAILNKGHKARQVDTLDFLTEIDYGPDENEPEEAVIARIGIDAIRAWDFDASVPPGWKVDPEKILNDWAEFLETHRSIDGDILVVTSNGIARFILQLVKPLAQPDSIKLKTGAFGIIVASQTELNLLHWNIRP